MDRGNYFLFEFSRELFCKDFVRGRTFDIGFGFKTVHLSEDFLKLQYSF